MRGHDLLQAVTFDEQLFVSLLAAMVVVLFYVDDGTPDCRHTLQVSCGYSAGRTYLLAHLHNDLGQYPLQFA